MVEADSWNVDRVSSAICFSGLGTALISESSRVPFQCQCRQDRPSLLFKRTKSFFFKRPATVCRRKVNKKGTSAGQIS